MAQGNQSELCNGIVVVQVDQEECSAIWAVIEEDVVAGHNRVVLDFSDVTYLNSMNIAGIITLRNKIEQQGGCLILAELRDQIIAIFRILKLERIFDLNLDRSTAVERVGA